MFGGIFGGEDVNEGAMGGGAQGQAYYESAFGSQGDLGQVSGQGIQGSSSQNFMQDPADLASQEAMKNANAIYLRGAAGATQNYQGQQGSGGMFGGLMQGIHNIRAGGPMRKKSRTLARAQAWTRYSDAVRARDQYLADSAIQEQRLLQSYSGRGLGESSIKNEGMKYFNETRARQLAAMQDQISLAEMNKSLVNSQIKFSYGDQYAQDVGMILTIAAAAA